MLLRLEHFHMLESRSDPDNFILPDKHPGHAAVGGVTRTSEENKKLRRQARNKEKHRNQRGGTWDLDPDNFFLRDFFFLDFFWGIGPCGPVPPPSPRVEFHSASSYCCVDYT